MKPFAYQYLQLDYDNELDANVTCPTLRSIYEHILAKVVGLSEFLIDFYVIYPDGTRQLVVLDERFKVKMNLDQDALLLEARDIAEANKSAWKKWMEKESNRITVTGSPRLCDYTEDKIVEQLIKQRQWRWKTVEEIDWVALEKELEKVD